ncbi:MAG: hypothetical protein DRP45_03450 [Candidatus Zixiibacteriota bacterium]|nr:MAG: hypothetical protein DRP45_03450 [candidate division Zixibacteria bacterium]
MPGISSIDGLVSGFNTTEIVDALIQLERRPAYLLELSQAEKTNIVSSYKALQAKILALGTAVDKLARKTTFHAANIQMSDDGYISAKATGRVGTGSYDLQVLSLARNHQLASQGFESESTATFGTGTISIAVGDGSARTITIDASNNSMIGIQKAINDSNCGVRANIVNDGSSSDPYRLVLSAEQTGLTNSISITSSLTGGDNFNYSTGSFDAPEMLSLDSGSTAQVSLGAMANFTGDENKIYTFTVQGTGAQTVGDDNITIHWSDGTNEGDLLFTMADDPEDLSDPGGDGLQIALSSGVLHGGDTFQITSFAPTLQEASDARLAIGSTGGGGSPITVTSQSNTFNDVIGNVTLSLHKETEVGQYLNVTTAVNVSAIKSEISSLIEKYNDVMTFIDNQNKYDSDSEQSGILFGDRTLQIVQNSIRRSIGSRIDSIDSRYNQLYSVGIRTGADGTLTIRDHNRLGEALENSLDDVIRLFTTGGSTSSNHIEFVTGSPQTEDDQEFEVDITAAATHGMFDGSGITNPATTPLVLNASSNRIKLSIDGLHSDEIVLSDRTYNTVEQLVAEIQEKIDSDEKIGNRGLTVEWIASGSDTGYLSFTSSTYGSNSKVSMVSGVANSALSVLGLATGTAHDGQDVAGTINGESATGTGQSLVGDKGNATTDGLKLKITFDSSQITGNVEGTVTVSKGIASRLSDKLDSLTAAGDGLFDRRIRSYQNQVDQLKLRIEEFDERLESRRESLFKRFMAMEEALGQLNAQSSWLSSQLAGINANWSSAGRS